MQMIQDHSHALFWQDERETQGCVQAAFPFLGEKGHVVSLVGGGGKSTLLDYLAKCFAARGMRTVLMTTTNIACPDDWCADMAQARECWAAGRAAACGERQENGKFRMPPPAFLSALLEEAEAVVIEADGAHMRACKAPAAHEPVILPQTDIVIGVMGAEVLGHPIGEICHRPQLVAALLGCRESHALTAQDMAEILLSPQGTRKAVEDRTYYTVINKCDGGALLENGRQVRAALLARGHDNTVLTSFVDS